MISLRTWGPAAVLFTLVLSVFFVLQGFGPESTLRKFHIAAANHDSGQIQKLTTVSSSPQSVLRIQSLIADLARQGYRYDVRGIVRPKGLQRSSVLGDRVIVEVVYSPPMGQVRVSMLYVVDKIQGRWEVNAQASIELITQASAPPGTSF